MKKCNRFHAIYLTEYGMACYLCNFKSIWEEKVKEMKRKPTKTKKSGNGSPRK